MGRPSIFNLELASEICARIATSADSIATICEADDMPTAKSVFLWLAKHPDFLQQYAHAKQAQADYLAEEMLDIADDGRNDWMERLDKDGKSIGWELNGEHVQRSRVRLDTRKWLASKLKPKKYGDAVTLKGDAENPLTPLNDAELVAKHAALLEKIKKYET